MRPTAKLAAIATAVFAVLIAPAGIASAEESPQEVLNRLQNEGYQVNVDRVGSAPINQCVVTNVRNPQTVTERCASTTAGTSTAISTGTSSK